MSTPTAARRKGHLVPLHGATQRVRDRCARHWGRAARRQLDTCTPIRQHAADVESRVRAAVIAVQLVRSLPDAHGAGDDVARYFGGESVDLDALVAALVQLCANEDPFARRALLALAEAVAAWRDLNVERVRALLPSVATPEDLRDDAQADLVARDAPTARAVLRAASPPTGERVKTVVPSNAPNVPALAHPPVTPGGACARSCMRSRH